jgi:hypothetical protein
MQLCDHAAWFRHLLLQQPQLGSLLLTRCVLLLVMLQQLLLLLAPQLQFDRGICSLDWLTAAPAGWHCATVTVLTTATFKQG